MLRSPEKLPPPAHAQLVCVIAQVRPRIHPEDEPHIAFFIPAIQVLRLTEVRVAAQQDSFEPGLTTQGDRLIKSICSPLVRRTIAAAIDHIERLTRVRQGDHQRMIAPGPLV